MKCPLFIMNDTRAQLGEETEIGDCIKEACAWWDETADKCSVLNLSLTLSSTGGVLGQMVNKMP